MYNKPAASYARFGGENSVISSPLWSSVVVKCIALLHLPAALAPSSSSPDNGLFRSCR